MKEFKFIDLFAGIGGFHLAMESLGGECVFASEMDLNARKTYTANFSNKSPKLFENELFNEDIRTIIPEEIPDFDVLCAGFPCQPFSQAGYKRGFDDNHKSERGNLFFNIVDILEAKKPKAFFLENVRGIVKHDNGKTFKVIRDILENELGYSFYFKVVKAADYGLPQLRPRAYMIGFRNEGILRNFEFPLEKPLKFNMSDVWEGKCSREIGFTIRVGGRGSNINDRRNWDAYLVDGEVKKLSIKEAKKMQGFPLDFEFPVAKTQAMKQLGNSVAIDAVEVCAKKLLDYMSALKCNEVNMSTKNKGEWTELLSFIKLVNDRRIDLANKDLKKNGHYFNVTKVTTKNINYECLLENSNEITIKSKTTGEEKKINKDNVINNIVISNITNKIIEGSRTFEIKEFDLIENSFGFSMVKGGNSNQKSDIVLDLENNNSTLLNEGFGIKSYLGSKPTLLNASGNTNFIYEAEGISLEQMDEINKISTRTKLVDRINAIYSHGGNLKFYKTEKDILDFNLKAVDSAMPEIISAMLYEFFVKRTNSVKQNLLNIHNNGHLNKSIAYGDLQALEIKVKNLLVSSLLGFFPGKRWNGEFESNGTIVVKEDGEQVGFHIVDLTSLKEYLFENIRFDTPSTSRHRYGSLFVEKGGNIYFKLNLQLRF
jgi:DNA (cytosine-5)-methyltransferase 1